MERYNPLTRALNVATWSLQREVVAVSGDVAESIRSHAGVGVPVTVILNGVDSDHYRPRRIDQDAIRDSLGIPKGSSIVGTVAVFRPQKALHHWLDAARRIRVLRPDVRFLIVGFGPLERELRALVDKQGMTENVVFAGNQADVRPLLSIMDVFLMSSRVEGLPVALLEAMAMERAVVSTAVGGVPEVVAHGRSGMLTKPERPDLLADAVLKLLSSRVLRHSLGRRARERVLERFSVARMDRELGCCYERLVGIARENGDPSASRAPEG